MCADNKPAQYISRISLVSYLCVDILAASAGDQQLFPPARFPTADPEQILALYHLVAN
jgi:hypothetical protein